jgi:hypothetical protein
MNYEFLTKAQSQPDLSDFCEYLLKPLSILEDIQQRYKKLQVSKKVEPENLETYHKVDVILEKHLPEMVDNFCDFTFDYRNNKSLDMQGYSSLTAKELLLKNLAKVIEEIEIIEKDFNRNNSFHAVVQNKVLENYGHKPELCLETGRVVSNNLQLDNKFDYEKFVEANQFKKEVTTLSSDLDLIEHEDNENDCQKVEKSSSSIFGSLIFELFAVLALGILAFIGVCSMYSNELEEKAVANLSNIRKEVKSLNPDNNYDGIHIEQLSSNKSFGKSSIEVSAVKIEKENDAFAIKFQASEGYLADTCEAISEIVDQFDIIKINNFIFKNGKPVSQKTFESYCENYSFGYYNQPNIVTLISK